MCEGDLRARRLDIAVTCHGLAAAEEDRDAELFRDHLVGVADRHNPLLRRKGPRLADVTEEPWTLSPSDTILGRLVATAFRCQGLVLEAQVIWPVQRAVPKSMPLMRRSAPMIRSPIPLA